MVHSACLIKINDDDKHRRRRRKKRVVKFLKMFTFSKIGIERGERTAHEEMKAAIRTEGHRKWIVLPRQSLWSSHNLTCK